jgi:hypothetical protein
MEITIAISVVAVVVSVSAAIRSWKTDSTKDAKETAQRLTVLETQMGILFPIVSKEFAYKLHQPHEKYKRRDELIEKYADDSITLDEMKEFIELLKETARDNGADLMERNYAEFVIKTIEMRMGV